MYSISDYGAMIADRVRTGAFVRALRAAVKPDSTVVDIGTGTGIFALLACAFGARRVYAIEPDDAIQLAREMALANGWADRIHFHSGSVDRCHPARASGRDRLRHRRHAAVVSQSHPLDRRRAARFLDPGGVLIPQQDTAWAAIIESPDWYARADGPVARQRLWISTWMLRAVSSEHLRQQAG